MGPNYRSPAQHMPSTWVGPPTTQASITVQEPVRIDRWWTTFNDPELDSLIRRAVGANLTLREAEERVREARAQLGIATAGFFPTVTSSGSYRRSFSAGSGSTVVVTSGSGPGTISGGGTTTKTIKPRPRDLWQAGFDSTWELDIFGGVRRGIEAANATYESTIEDRRDVLVTLLGDVATAYISLRGFQQEVLIAQENLTSQVHTADVTRKKQRGGLTTGLDVANAEAQVATTRSQIAGFQSLAQQQLYVLSVLLGQEPLALAGELLPPAKIPITPPVVPLGVPAELLRRRPDIRRAERQLAAATANIGVAMANLYPRFTLNGTLTLQGARYESLTNWGNRFWSFGPNFSWALFDAGRIWSDVEVQNALQAQALTAYRQTILVALQDVETALTAYAQEQQRRAALADAVAANQRAVSIATRAYENGQTDFLNVLDAERSLYGTQDALVQSDRAVGTDLVALYKALGGGWEIGEPSATTRPVRQ